MVVGASVGASSLKYPAPRILSMGRRRKEPAVRPEVVLVERVLRDRFHALVAASARSRNARSAGNLHLAARYCSASRMVYEPRSIAHLRMRLLNQDALEQPCQWQGSGLLGFPLHHARGRPLPDALGRLFGRCSFSVMAWPRVRLRRMRSHALPLLKNLHGGQRGADSTGSWTSVYGAL